MQSVASPTSCRVCPLQDCGGLRPLDERQLDFMLSYKKDEVRLDRGDCLLSQGEESRRLFTILSGILLRYRSLEDGRRQIVNFMFPGDFVGLQGAFEEPATHSVEALAPARLCVFDRHSFRDLCVDHPELGYDMTWLAAKEETALEEHLVALGRRTAKERVTYLAVWLIERALSTCVGENDNSLAIGVTQSQIADMLGLSLVHTNRTLKALKREGLLDWNQRRIRIPDLDRAREFAQFDSSSRRPRPFI